MTSNKFAAAAKDGRTNLVKVNQPPVELPRDLERALDEALVESFPASDPVAIDVEKMPDSLGLAKVGIGVGVGADGASNKRNAPLRIKNASESE